MVAVGLSKVVVVTTNLIFMIFGLACLVVGIIFKLGWDDVRDAFDDQATKHDLNLQNAGDAVGIAAITFGSFILIISLVGCLGACFRWKPLLVTYAIIVMLLVVAQVSVVGYAGVKGKDAEDDLKAGLQDSLKNYTEFSSTDRSKAWSAIFSVAECCGVEKYKEDFKKNPFVKDVKDRTAAGISTSSQIPITCCKDMDYEDDLTVDVFTKNKDCLNTESDKYAYTTGCYTKVKDWITDSRGVLIGVGCAILFIELLLIALAFFLCCRED